MSPGNLIFMIAKLSKSGNAIVIIDDFGNTYVTSKTYLMSMVSGRMKAPFVQLTRMPVPAEIGRFKPSPVLGKDQEQIQPGDERWSEPQCSHNVDIDRNSEAGMSVTQMKKREEKKKFEDIKI